MRYFEVSRSRADRGVSEVVSFLLLFAVLIGVSITGGVLGIESLEEASRGDDVHAAVGAFSSVRADMYDLTAGAVYRMTEIDLNAGGLQFNEPINITVSVSTVGDSEFVHSIRAQPIVFDLGTEEVRFVAGAVLLDQPDGGVVRVGPRFKIDADQAIIPLVNTSYVDGPASIGGSGTGYVVGYRTDDTILRYEPTNSIGEPVDAVVTVAVETPRPELWRLYFDSDPRFQNVVLDENSSTVSAEFVTKRLYLKVSHIEVRLDV